MFTNAELQKFRADTPGVNNQIHLNNAGSSLPPQVVIDAMVEYLHLEAKIGGYEAADQEKVSIQSFYTTLGKFLNTSPKNIAFETSATDAYAKALSSIDFKKGDYILTTTNDYASNFLAFFQLKKLWGIEILIAENTSEGIVDLDSIEHNIKNYRPKIVAITYIPTNSGLIQPAIEIGALCQQYDIWYLLDACQAAGQLPLDVQDLNCDFLSATLRKFCRGPRGTGFLYVSNKILDTNLEPMFVDLRSAEWTKAGHYDLHPEAKRFEWWERSFAGQIGAQKAIEYALQLNMQHVEHRVKHLAAYCRSQLETIPGIQLLDRGGQLGGIVTFNASGSSGTQLKQALTQTGINTSISTRSSALIDMDEKGVDWVLRVSPHYYNLESEIDTTIQAIRKILKT